MPFYAPNLPNLPFGLSDPPMQPMKPQPWKNPGADPQLQEMEDLEDPYTETWGLYTQGDDPQPVLDVDTCTSFKFGDTSKVSDFPVETGAFASYNKVIHAFQPKIKVAVGSSKDGSTSSQDRIQALLDLLFNEVRSTNIYDLYMPEYYYEGVTIEKYDFTRTATKGRGMLEVELTLMQVIQVAQTYTTVKLPKPKAKKAADGSEAGKQQSNASNANVFVSDWQKHNPGGDVTQYGPHYHKDQYGNWQNGGVK